MLQRRSFLGSLLSVLGAPKLIQVPLKPVKYDKFVALSLLRITPDEELLKYKMFLELKRNYYDLGYFFVLSVEKIKRYPDKVVFYFYDANLPYDSNVINYHLVKENNELVKKTICTDTIYILNCDTIRLTYTVNYAFNKLGV